MSGAKLVRSTVIDRRIDVFLDGDSSFQVGATRAAVVSSGARNRSMRFELGVRESAFCLLVKASIDRPCRVFRAAVRNCFLGVFDAGKSGDCLARGVL